MYVCNELHNAESITEVIMSYRERDSLFKYGRSNDLGFAGQT